MGSKDIKRDIETDVEFTRNFQDILVFYLFKSPIEGVTHQGLSFKDIGWVGSSRLQMLERLMKSCDDFEGHWISCSKDCVEKYLDTNKKYDTYIVCSDEYGKVKTIIYAIRNAFAHGGFEIITTNMQTYYVFTNHFKGKIKAKMRIKEETLLEWKKLILTNPKYLTKKERKKIG